MDLRIRIRDYRVLVSFKGDRLPQNSLGLNRYQFSQDYVKGYNIIELRLHNKQSYLFRVYDLLLDKVNSIVTTLIIKEQEDKINIEKVLRFIHQNVSIS